MLTRMRDLIRFQGRVRRLPALYAISLWAAGVIEFVGALVLLFVYSAISKAGAETTNQDAVYEELSSSLFGGEVAKTILNALLVPGTLLVVGVSSSLSLRILVEHQTRSSKCARGILALKIPLMCRSIKN